LKAREISLIEAPSGQELWGVSINIHEKYIKDGKFLAHLGLQSKVFLELLTDIIVWVGFCTSSPQHGVKYQH
jgi:hypothetical protein